MQVQLCLKSFVSEVPVSSSFQLCPLPFSLPVTFLSLSFPFSFIFPFSLFSSLFSSIFSLSLTFSFSLLSASPLLWLPLSFPFLFLYQIKCHEFLNAMWWTRMIRFTSNFLLLFFVSSYISNYNPRQHQRGIKYVPLFGSFYTFHQHRTTRIIFCLT